MSRRLVNASVAGTLTLLLGCQPSTLPGAAGSRAPAARPARASDAPRSEPLVVPQRGATTRLLGKVALIAHPASPALADPVAGLLRDQAGELLSDMGGAIISNNSGKLVSDSGGSLVSNNGGGALGQARPYGLRSAGGLGVYGLADARIELLDAAGKPLVDEAGRPVQAVSGADASYRLEAVLPPGNLVARVRLWNGGELKAIVAREGAEQATANLSTASTLGASYVLSLAGGEQALLDKLPRSENERLVRALDVVGAFATGAFPHETATLEAITTKLRQRVPALDQVAEEVETLLLGQARLGAGRPATEVPLGGPSALLVQPEGLLIAELRTGRLRRLGPDGTLQTLMDRNFGALKANLLNLLDVVAAPDGTLYLANRGSGIVYRAAPGGAPEPWVGTGEPGQGPVGTRTGTRITPRSLTLGPDGTLWIGEAVAREGDALVPPRLLAVRPDGRLEAFQAPTWADTDLTGVSVAADGTVWVLDVTHEKDKPGGVGRVSRLRGQAFETLAGGFMASRYADMALAPGGTVVVGTDGPQGVGTLDARGTFTPLPQLEALTALGLRRPGPVAFGPDGTLHVADMGMNLVAAVPPGGTPRLLAGAAATFQTRDGQGLALNMPGGLAVDDQQRLYVSEPGSHTVRLFDGRGLRTMAGSAQGAGGDGGPATAAGLNGPKGLGWRAGELWLLDDANGSLRRITPDGRIETMAGTNQPGLPSFLTPGTTAPNDQLNLGGAFGLTFGRQGEPIWTTAHGNQIQRLDNSGPRPVIRHVAGLAGDAAGANLGMLLAPPKLDPAAIRFILPFGVALGPAGELYVSDVGTMQIYRIRGYDTATPSMDVFAGLHISETLARFTQDPTVQDAPGQPAREVMLGLPTGLAVDAAGNLYVAEAGMRDLEVFLPLLGQSFPIKADMLPPLPPRVRRITPEGVVTTVAGPGGRVLADAASETALLAPTSVALFPDGRLAIADIGTNLVHILPAGSY